MEVVRLSLPFSRLAVSIFVIFLLSAGAGFAAPCGDCHGEWLTKAKTLSAQHPPFADGDCGSCHKEHGESNKLVLAAEGAKLCMDCHDDPAAGGKKVHTVVADSGCLDCHNPHSSPNKKLLVKPAAKLCLDCHDEFSAGGKKKVHTAVTDGSCLDCHNPHSSVNAKLTTKPGAKLCAECHEVPTKEQPVLHTALDDGCSGCHDPHASVNGNLLVNTYKNEKNVKVYAEKDYALCFDCHDAALVAAEGEKTAGATGFRNGTRNLHNIHVMGELVPNKYGIVKRGTPHACGVCHGPHASDQEFVLIRQYDCGEVFCFTLNYTKEKDGGFCRVGCHKPLAYSRSGEATVVPVTGEATPPEAKK
jgi:predicted CXXCH cytochrome family protein